MYVPEHFKLGDVAEQHALMRAYPFAALITMSDAGYEVTHLPTKLKSEGALGVVECHVSRANPHWREIAKSGRGLLMYTGPQAYITPGWYPSKAAHGKVVPTWNYATVHVWGTPRVIDDAVWGMLWYDNWTRVMRADLVGIEKRWDTFERFNAMKIG